MPGYAAHFSQSFSGLKAQLTYACGGSPRVIMIDIKGVKNGIEKDYLMG